MIRCKNCENEFDGKFCNNCSQPADTFKINHLFIILEIRKTFVHFWDDGLFYTTKSLFANPGKAIKEYLDGKRIQHIKPFSFLILTGGLYVLLSRYFHINMLTDDLEGHHANELNNLLYTYYTQIQLLMLVVYAVFSIVFFKRTTYNFYEFIVIHTYLAGQRLLISIVLTIPLLMLLNGKSYIKPVMYISAIPGLLLMIWTYCHLFKNRNTAITITKTLLMIMLTLLVTSTILAVTLMVL